MHNRKEWETQVSGSRDTEWEGAAGGGTGKLEKLKLKIADYYEGKPDIKINNHWHITWGEALTTNLVQWYI